MKTLSKCLAVLLILLATALIVSTVTTCIIEKLCILHVIVVLSFVLSFALMLIIFAVDWLKDLYYD